MSNKKPLRAFICTKKMLTQLDTAGVSLSNLFFPRKMEGILSPSDFKKYNSEVWINTTGVCTGGYNDAEYTSDLDDIHGGICLMPEHFEGHLEDSAYDKDILSDSYEGDILTYPVLYKVDSESNVFVHLIQLKDSMTKDFTKGWGLFYKSLMQEGVSIQKLCEQESFNEYINMTNGLTSKVQTMYYGIL